MKFKVSAMGEAALVLLSGDIDSDVEEVVSAIDTAVGEKNLVFDCQDLRRINSIGVKGWINAVNRWGKRRPVAFRNCPHAFIDMAIMVPAFLGTCEIQSFQATFKCDNCGREALQLVEVKGKQATGTQPTVCPKCGGKLLPGVDLESDLEFVLNR